MKNTLFLMFCFYFIKANAQEAISVLSVESNTSFQTTGTAKIIVKPEIYGVNITLQEIEKRMSNITIGKTPIDSIKAEMLQLFKKVGAQEKFLQTINNQFKEVTINQTPGYFQTISYKYTTTSLEQAIKLIDGLKFPGVKNATLSWSTSEKRRNEIRDSLFEIALSDARKSASFFASKLQKVVSKVGYVSISSLDLNSLEKENTEFFSTYRENKFEYDSRDLYVKCTLNVTFVLKGAKVNY